MVVRPLRLMPAALAAALAVAAGCADDRPRAMGAPAAPAVAGFPEPRGRDLAALRRGLRTGLELAPGTAVHEPGRNRYGFALFDRARRQVSGAPTALYVSRGSGGKVEGPYPTRSESLDVRPQFQSEGVSSDPDAARALYVAELQLRRPGVHQVMAVARLDDRLVATVPVPMKVVKDSPVPEVGEVAPRTSTPTVASTAGALDLLETRRPPDSMHEVDFADVVGRRSVLLLFGTPALCQSRVCGPVVDLAEQAKAEHEGDAAFVHMEIYEQNRIEAGLRPQVKAWKLPTEPWAFAVGRDGRVAARLEGAFSARELEEALARATR